MNRTITQQYQDPLDLIWLHAARQCGIQIVRDATVFASWDGKGTLRIGTPETLDADDCLAQMILHELCHALIAGPESQKQEDWGLDYDRPQDRLYEQAALRLQAALADPFGLRSFFAATTDFRSYFNRLPSDALLDKSDPAAALARQTLLRESNQAWIEVIRESLRRTAMIATAVQGVADRDSLWKIDDRAPSTRVQVTYSVPIPESAE